MGGVSMANAGNCINLGDFFDGSGEPLGSSNYPNGWIATHKSELKLEYNNGSDKKCYEAQYFVWVFKILFKIIKEVKEDYNLAGLNDAPKIPNGEIKYTEDNNEPDENQPFQTNANSSGVFAGFLNVLKKVCDKNNLDKNHFWLYWEKDTNQKNSQPLPTQPTTNKPPQISVEKYSKNIIYYGPPGTGKTRKAKIEAVKIVARDETLTDSGALKQLKNDAEYKNQIQLVQFHPSYSYNDFMETIDITKNGYTNRIFKEFAEKAHQDKDKNYVLIIDEINRANVSEVLGELLYGLEYRGENITTGVSNQPFAVPDNLYIIGTMNTADKSLQTLDYAVRRRFAFKEVKSEEPVAIEGDSNSMYYKIASEDDTDNSKTKYFLKEAFRIVRQDVAASVARGIESEDIMPGISYFIINGKNTAFGEEPLYDDEHFEYKMNYELIPLLKEYIKDGMFTKRKKIDDSEKSLIEIIQNGEYFDRLEESMSNKPEQMKGE